jgi:hypothetical protein
MLDGRCRGTRTLGGFRFVPGRLSGGRCYYQVNRGPGDFEVEAPEIQDPRCWVTWRIPGVMYWPNVLTDIGLLLYSQPTLRASPTSDIYVSCKVGQEEIRCSALLAMTALALLLDPLCDTGSLLQSSLVRFHSSVNHNRLGGPLPCLLLRLLSSSPLCANHQ